jgi:peptidyl-prolyl cis-trans isomerase C
MRMKSDYDNVQGRFSNLSRDLSQPTSRPMMKPWYLRSISSLVAVSDQLSSSSNKEAAAGAASWWWWLRQKMVDPILISRPIIISPLTLIILLAVVTYLILYLIDIIFPPQEYCIASHILIPAPDPKQYNSSSSSGNNTSTSGTTTSLALSTAIHQTEQKLQLWRDQIGPHYHDRFMYVASHYSVCPSGRENGGYLGRFGRHVMAPPFESVCFDNKTPLGVTVGPILTQFGYHLVFVHERQILEKSTGERK